MERDALQLVAAFLGGSAAAASWLLALVGVVLGAVQLSAARRLAPGGHGRGLVVSEDGAWLRPECPLPHPGVVLETASGRFVLDDELSGRFAAAWGDWSLEGRSALITDLRIESRRVVLVSRIAQGHLVAFAGWLGGPILMGISLPFTQEPPAWYIPVGLPLLFATFGGAIVATNIRRGRRFAVRWAIEVRDAIESHAGLPRRPEA